MLFTGSIYAVFLFVAYVGFWALRTRKFARTLFLVAASYTFYAYGTWETAVQEQQDVPFGKIGWSALCLSIIFVGSTLDFALARILHRTEGIWARRGLLLLSIVYYLGVLAVFKYFDFAIGSVRDALGWVGISVSVRELHLVLPFGISFFTFETMSYTIDVYRRELVPTDNYLDYLLFVCFFPHLVAGPIVRPHTMLPQLAREPHASDEMKAEGLLMIATGLGKKIAIGDTLSEYLVNDIFEHPERYSSLETLIGVYGYAIKIYADFSGYTDVAIGSAKLFGFELPQNFNAPYIARNLQEFWHRWHISLSTWLRDYLYVPLGGSRGSSFLTYRNLMLTMVLGGLWHGASWNFVIWGVLHGAALALTRMFQRATNNTRDSRWATLKIVATFHYVCFAWIFFNAKTFGGAIAVLQSMTLGTLSMRHIPVRAFVALGAGVLFHLVPKGWEDTMKGRFAIQGAFVQGTLLAAMAYGIHLCRSGSKSLGFIYGQF